MTRNTISRRKFLEGLAVGSGVVVLAACAPAAPAAPEGEAAAPAEGGDAAPAAGAVTIAWWDYMAAANGAALDTQMANYMEANPSVAVERTYIPFADLKQKLLQGAAAGQLPDVVIIDNPDHSSFARWASSPI
ncbi:MAG: twin-arginine translocation signal domain-containing protein [Caldilineaceae bacterium]